MSHVEEDIRAAFSKFDKDGSGTISRMELVGCLECLYGGDHDKAVDVGATILSECDDNGDQTITWEEFKGFLLKQ